jgi:hypothetical protein
LSTNLNQAKEDPNVRDLRDKGLRGGLGPGLWVLWQSKGSNMPNIFIIEAYLQQPNKKRRI